MKRRGREEETRGERGGKDGKDKEERKKTMYNNLCGDQRVV